MVTYVEFAGNKTACSVKDKSKEVDYEAENFVGNSYAFAMFVQWLQTDSITAGPSGDSGGCGL